MIQVKMFNKAMKEGYIVPAFNFANFEILRGLLDAVKETKSHELLVVVEGVADTAEVAEEVTLIGMRQIFYARLPEVKGTAGTAAFILDEVTRISPVYKWTLDHTVEVDDPLELFPVTMIEVNGEE